VHAGIQQAEALELGRIDAQQIIAREDAGDDAIPPPTLSKEIPFLCCAF
jgi:hypothetical protein